MSLYKDCEDCLGSGIAITSNCCDAGYDLDIMICKECKEHLGDNECPSCNGQGIILKHENDTKEDY